MPHYLKFKRRKKWPSWRKKCMGGGVRFSSTWFCSGAMLWDKRNFHRMEAICSYYTKSNHMEWSDTSSIKPPHVAGSTPAATSWGWGPGRGSHIALKILLQQQTEVKCLIYSASSLHCTKLHPTSPFKPFPTCQQRWKEEPNASRRASVMRAELISRFRFSDWCQGLHEQMPISHRGHKHIAERSFCSLFTKEEHF